MAVKTAIAKPKFKTYISDFTIHFDPLSMRGKMIGVRKSDSDTKVKFSLVSPEGNEVLQKYQDAETLKLYTSEECSRMAQNGDELIIVDKQTLDAVKATPLPGNVINLSVHDSAPVNEAIFVEKSNGYIFIPDSKDPKNVKLTKSFTAAIAASPEKAFLGVCNFHGYEGLFRATVWRGHLVLQKQSYPDDINEHEVVQLPMDSEAKVIKSFFDKKTEPFSVENYRNLSVQRLREAVANPESMENIVFNETAPSDDDISSLLAALEDWSN